MENIINDIKQEGIRFNSNEDLQRIVDEIGDRQYVLLGEASHGTSEFYTVRAELSKMLIEQKGFKVIAVEGDWPSCFEVNRYIKGYDHQQQSSEEVLLNGFNRWPTWMWANEEISQLVNWLRDYNQSNDNKVGLYGIDVYSLWESMGEVIQYLQKTNSPDVEVAKKAFGCFEPFNRREENYGVSASFLSEDCIDEVIDLLTTIRRNRHQYSQEEEASLNLEVNALVAANAERYYRAMVQDDTESWNVRDYHMADVIEKLVEYYGSNTKVIVWEHNTHIGDARYTDMKGEGLVNLGQIVREKYGENNVYSVGFGTHHGTVIAAKKWGDTPEVMTVPEGEFGSWEDLFHQVGAYNQILVFNEKNRCKFSTTIGHRAIGVVYRPEYEHLGNYVPSNLSYRYDAFIFINRTRALVPLKIQMLV
ncbi:erythromycin esterase family protein [Litchfieldia alkalitelluris]|uniref:erythromycin esterase family protein n=1 Tax=Litchfieldia alkalitelluris TaxID=304268 RepID=UPI0009987259|nr:erythromycin esterase family protein [Litchfieldia alkalitelluris]